MVNDDLTEIEHQMNRMEQARQNLHFLEEQYKLLQLIEEYDLDPSEILANADPERHPKAKPYEVDLVIRASQRVPDIWKGFKRDALLLLARALKLASCVKLASKGDDDSAAGDAAIDE